MTEIIKKQGRYYEVPEENSRIVRKTLTIKALAKITATILSIYLYWLFWDSIIGFMGQLWLVCVVISVSVFFLNLIIDIIAFGRLLKLGVKPIGEDI